MISKTVNIRVSYKDTDRMGVVYHGNYPTYFEIGRVAFMRSLGYSYKVMEDELKVCMPVRSLEVKYLKPIYFDERITVNTTLKNLPRAKVRFYYQISNEAGSLAVEGTVDLVFVKVTDFTPVRPPPDLIQCLEPYF